MQTTMPAFLNNTTPVLQWADSTFDAFGVGKLYTITVTDLTVPASSTTVNVAPPVTPTGSVNGSLSLVNGHAYQMTVNASDIPGSFRIASGESAAVSTRVDVTAPATGAVQINGGAAATNNPAVTLTFPGAGDPPSAGQPASGVDGVQISHTGSFPCTVLVDSPACPVPFAASLPTTLAAGPDGLRTVSVRFTDKARPESNPCTVLCFPGTGNVSATPVAASILLDTHPPTVGLVQSAVVVAAGLPVSLDASSSTDGTGGANDSGVLLNGVTWTFGDGQTGNGTSISHSYATPGVFNGVVTVTDRAGNAATKTFVVVATNPLVGKLVTVGKYRVGKPGKVTITTTAATTFTGTLRLGKKIIKKFTVTGGPGEVALKFTPKSVGRHKLKIAGGGVTRTISIVVKR